MPKCSYVGPQLNCQMEAWEKSDHSYCIFHDLNLDKPKGKFESLLKKQIKGECPNERNNFSGYVFPNTQEGWNIGTLLENTIGKKSFKDAAYFVHTTFESNVDFTKVTFRKGAFFIGAVFERVARFNEAAFKHADFSNAFFTGSVHFYRTQFEGTAIFDETNFKNTILFRLTAFKGAVFF